MISCTSLASLRFNRAISLPFQLSQLTRNYAKKEGGGAKQFNVLAYFYIIDL